jgi:hypothetical protein
MTGILILAQLWKAASDSEYQIPFLTLYSLFFQLKTVSIERKSYIFEVVQSVPKGYAESLKKDVQKVTATALMARKMIRNGGIN